MVTHLEDIRDIVALAKTIGVNTIQLHGNNLPTDVLQIAKELPFMKIIKSIHVNSEISLRTIHSFVGIVDAILLDTANFERGQVGGTGLTHDWNLSANIVSRVGVPVILAGGLSPANVAKAVRRVRPYAVDVNSGVKSTTGYKDSQKLQQFIKCAKSALTNDVGY